MKCQNCGENDANFKFTEIINGDKIELLLCENCYKKLGFDSIKINLPINLSNFFADFFESYESIQHMPFLINSNDLKCEICNTTYDEFIKTGKLGCGNCYNAFSEKLDSILKRIQNNNQHIGKKAENTKETIVEEKQENEEILKLKIELKKLIKQEKYEEAAQIRDKIKKIEESQGE